eukprot:365830-Chlamydomonas_euryale.AAC.9
MTPRLSNAKPGGPADRRLKEGVTQSRTRCGPAAWPGATAAAMPHTMRPSSAARRHSCRSVNQLARSA